MVVTAVVVAVVVVIALFVPLLRFLLLLLSISLSLYMSLHLSVGLPLCMCLSCSFFLQICTSAGLQLLPVFARLYRSRFLFALHFGLTYRLHGHHARGVSVCGQYDSVHHRRE